MLRLRRPVRTRKLESFGATTNGPRGNQNVDRSAFGKRENYPTHMGVGRNPVPPVNIPIPEWTKMGGEFTFPKMVRTLGVDPRPSISMAIVREVQDACSAPCVGRWPQSSQRLSQANLSAWKLDRKLLQPLAQGDRFGRWQSRCKGRRRVHFFV